VSTSPASFDWDPVRSQAALTLYRTASRGLVQHVSGPELAQAQMGALVSAELLAAQAGVVPWFTLPDGTRGVLNVGAARERIDGASLEVRTVYLAAQGNARRLATQALPAVEGVPHPWLSVEPQPIGFLTVPVLIALTVFGVAAVVAGAWYASRPAVVQAQSDGLVEIAEVDAIAKLAAGELAATGKISPALIDALKPAAFREEAEASSWVLPVVLGGVAVAGGLYIASRKGWL
jgi:hypothetical protein